MTTPDATARVLAINAACTRLAGIEFKSSRRMTEELFGLAEVIRRYIEKGEVPHGH